MSDNFYLKRRSVLAKKMRNHPIKDDGQHKDLYLGAPEFEGFERVL